MQVRAARKALTTAAVILSVVGITLSTTGLTYGAATPPIADAAINKAYVAGGITHIGQNSMVAMVFTTKNLGPAEADTEMIVTVTGMHSFFTECVFKGTGWGAGGDACEWR